MLWRKTTELTSITKHVRFIIARITKGCSMKIYKNSQNRYRIMLPNGFYLVDSDLLPLIASSHKSRILEYPSIEACNRAIAQYNYFHVESEIGVKIVETVEDFEEVV